MRATASGAEQKQAIPLKNFRSSLKNGHSRYGDQTARFAPKLPFNSG